MQLKKISLFRGDLWSDLFLWIAYNLETICLFNESHFSEWCSPR